MSIQLRAGATDVTRSFLDANRKREREKGRKKERERETNRKVISLQHVGGL